jgi:hypothetical protein
MIFRVASKDATCWSASGGGVAYCIVVWCVQVLAAQCQQDMPKRLQSSVTYADGCWAYLQHCCSTVWLLQLTFLAAAVKHSGCAIAAGTPSLHPPGQSYPVKQQQQQCWFTTSRG